MVKPAATRARKKAKKVVSEGIAHVHASFNIKIVSIADVTPVPHNGCRPPKRRRM